MTKKQFEKYASVSYERRQEVKNAAKTLSHAANYLMPDGTVEKLTSAEWDAVDILQDAALNMLHSIGLD